MLVQLLHTANDSGHSGARMGLGPATLLSSGAAELLRAGGHQVEVVRIEPRDPFPTEIATAFAVAREIAVQVRTAIRQRRFPIVLAGNCIASVGAIAGHPAGRSGIVWLDSHADLHTPETTASGFLDGMALSVAAGDCWRGLAAGVPGFRAVRAEDIVLLGARDVDLPEEARLAELSIARCDVHAVRDRSVDVAAIFGALGERVARVHLHVDLDVLDPERVGRANQFAAPEGLLEAELLGLVSLLRARCRLASATLSSYDPSADTSGSLRDSALRLLERLAAG